MQKYILKFWNYLKRTYKNKLLGVMVMLLGYISYVLDGRDGTGFIFTIVIGIPMFIMDEEEED